jgi:hypothetical protein
MGWIGLAGLADEIEQGINMDNVNRVTMTHGDFGVCLAALVQAESYWDFQLNRCDGDMPGGFTRPEAGEILRSLKEVRLKVEGILQMVESSEHEDHVVVS